jgi:osmotically-inducible protein OsmY
VKNRQSLGLAIIVSLLLTLFSTGCSCSFCNWYSTALNTGIDVGTMLAADRSLYNVANDYSIKSEITGSILDEAMLLNISTDVYQGMVMLTGIVTDPNAKTKAEKLARRASGVREVFNEIQVTEEALTTRFTDMVIEKKLSTYLLLSSGVSSINFRWRAVDGVVYFMGIAKSRHELDKVLAVAKVSGVRRIVTHIFLSDAVVVDAIPTVPTAEIEIAPKVVKDDEKPAAKPRRKRTVIGDEDKRDKLPAPTYGGIPPEMPTYFDRGIDELH